VAVAVGLGVGVADGVVPVGFGVGLAGVGVTVGVGVAASPGAMTADAKLSVMIVTKKIVTTAADNLAVTWMSPLSNNKGNHYNNNH
jgi:hypothetical protein